PRRDVAERAADHLRESGGMGAGLPQDGGTCATKLRTFPNAFLNRGSSAAPLRASASTVTCPAFQQLERAQRVSVVAGEQCGELLYLRLTPYHRLYTSALPRSVAPLSHGETGS